MSLRDRIDERMRGLEKPPGCRVCKFLAIVPDRAEWDELLAMPNDHASCGAVAAEMTEAWRTIAPDRARTVHYSAIARHRGHLESAS